MTTLFLVEDHSIVREGVRALLEQESDFRVIGEAASGLAVVRLVSELRPEVVVLDLMLPEINGLELTRQLHQKYPELRIVILSMYSNGAYVAKALNNGANAYVLKGSGASDLVAAIRSVLAGRHYLSPPLSEQSIAEYLANASDTSMDCYKLLTARELEVLSLAAQGLTNAQIGARLFISPRTVEVHRANVMRKLGLHTQSELLRYAVGRGILLVDLPTQQGPRPPAV